MNLFEKQELPILSVHTNRDIDAKSVQIENKIMKKGERSVYDALFLADKLRTKVCVFHLWDTWKIGFDVNRLNRDLHAEATQFPEIKASVEDIPTHLKTHTFPIG